MAFVTSAAVSTSSFTSPRGATCARPTAAPRAPAAGAPVTMGAGQLREVRDRIQSVKNTEKITDAMRLVAAAKVRRAQDAVLRTRPFSETLQKVLGGLIQRLEMDFSDLPLLQTREAKTVAIVVITGDRGLCGSYNTYAIRKAEERRRQLEKSGCKVEFVTIGKKATTYFRRRGDIRRNFECGQAPTAAEATAISDELLAEYLSGEVDRVELVYTKFVSLISSNASVRTLLPLSPSGLEEEGDEVFQLTTEGGEFKVKTESYAPSAPEQFPSDMIFEQEPLQILNAILPLYLNGQILRTLQESVASELAARMQSMQSATDNAKSLRNAEPAVQSRASGRHHARTVGDCRRVLRLTLRCCVTVHFLSEDASLFSPGMSHFPSSLPPPSTPALDPPGSSGEARHAPCSRLRTH